MARYFWRCFLATLIICSCSYFSFLNYEICNNLTFVGKQWLIKNNNATTKTANSQWSFFYGTFAIGSLLGSLPSSSLAEKIGRKNGLLLACPVSIVGSVITTLSISFSSHFFAIFGRLLMGIACGLSTLMATLWISELAPTEKRGFFMSLEGFLYYLSNLVAYVVSLPSLLGTESLWGYCFLLSGAMQFLLFPFLAYLPDSPRHLYFTLGHLHPKFRRSVSYYHGAANVENTLTELDAESQLHPETINISFYQLFKTPHLRRLFILSVVLYGSNCFCGISSVVAYSTEMFEMVGISHNLAAYLTVLATLLMLPSLGFPLVIDRICRRPLCIIAYISCGLVSIVLVFTYWVAKPSIATGWWVTILIVIYKYAQQIQELVSIIVATEILCQQTRSKGTMVGTFAFFGMGSILTYLFLPMSHEMSMAWAMTPYAIVPFILAIVIWLFMPETRMRTIEEIYSDQQQPLIDKKNGDSYGTTVG